MKDLSSGADVEEKSSLVRSVPKELSHTPNERFAQRLVRWLGVYMFIINTILLLCVISKLIFPTTPISTEMLAAGFLFFTFFIHIGMFIENATDSGGKNWCALGVMTTWVGIFGTFIIGGTVLLIIRSFS